MGFFFFSHFSLNLVIFLTLFAFSLADNEQFPPVTLKGVSIERPVLDVSPSLLLGQSNIRCERFQVSGISRFKLGSYANSLHVTLAPSFVIPKKLHNKIKLCFHRNNTLGWCQCENNEWRGLHKWIWSEVMSPYETRYVDVKIDGEIPGSVTVALDEDFQQLRLISLAIGLTLMLLAPIISSWVPFYYGSSMAIGIFLVVIIILFQLRAELLLLHQYSMIVNSILQSFGMSEEMLNLKIAAKEVAFSVLLGIILAGAALGYWSVRRFVISKEDGSVDAGVAQFVKWAMRVTGATFVLQSTLDPPLAIGALISCGAVCKLISLIKLLHGCNGKKVTKEEWDGFMRNSIEQALAERAKSSEVNN